MRPPSTSSALAPAHLPWWLDLDDAPVFADQAPVAPLLVDPWRHPTHAGSVADALAIAADRDALAAAARAARLPEAGGTLLVLAPDARLAVALAAGPGPAGRVVVPGEEDDALDAALDTLDLRAEPLRVLVDAATDPDERHRVVELLRRARLDPRDVIVEARGRAGALPSTSPAVLLGLGLLGLDVDAWEDGARTMDAWCDRQDAATDPGSALAAAWAALAPHGGLRPEPGSTALAPLARHAGPWSREGGPPLGIEVVGPETSGAPGARAARRRRAGSLPVRVGLRRLDAFALAGLLALLERAAALRR